MSKELYEKFVEGVVFFFGQTIDLKDKPWREHPDNKGVYLKDCLTLEQTGQKFSCHLVRLEAGAVIARHQHPHSLELHEVRAGAEGLGLWAKFIPVSL